VNLRLSLIGLSIAVCTQNAIKKASKSGDFGRILDAGAAHSPARKLTQSDHFLTFLPDFTRPSDAAATEISHRQ